MENISAEEYKNPRKEEKAKKGMTAQTRLILPGFAVSTVFIVLAACFAIFSIDKNMNSAY